MTSRRLILTSLFAIALSGAVLQPSAGAAAFDRAVSESAQDTRAELKRRFQERYAEIFKLKERGIVGETYEGLLAAVNEAYLERERIENLLKAENDDREALYELLAEEVKGEVDRETRQKITPAIIAARNARRNFQNARAFELLMLEDGVWVQKRNEDAYQRILELKKDGAIGEAGDGYLAVRQDQAGAARATEQENDRRRTLYREIAEAIESSVEGVADEYAEQHVKHARPGDWLKDDDGEWEQVRRR